MIQLGEVASQLEFSGWLSAAVELRAVSGMLAKARVIRKATAAQLKGLETAHQGMSSLVESLLREKQLGVAAEVLTLRRSVWAHEANLPLALQTAKRLRDLVTGLHFDPELGIVEALRAAVVGLDDAGRAERDAADASRQLTIEAVRTGRARVSALDSVRQVRGR